MSRKDAVERLCRRTNGSDWKGVAEKARTLHGLGVRRLPRTATFKRIGIVPIGSRANDVKRSTGKMKKSLIVLAVMLSMFPALTVSAAQPVSRVYVNAYPCMTDQAGKPVENPGTPIVTLYDRIYYGDAKYHGFSPTVVIEKTAKGELDFHFDLQPGNYDVYIKFSNLPRLFIGNGPLIVIPAHDRHLLVAGCGLADWHSVAAIAGNLPLTDVT